MMTMPPMLRFLVLVFSGWVNRQQQEVIEYLRAENLVLREQLGDRRSRIGNQCRSVGHSVLIGFRPANETTIGHARCHPHRL